MIVIWNLVILFIAAIEIQWWANVLSSYNYTLGFLCDKRNSNADFCKRFPSSECNEQSSVC